MNTLNSTVQPTYPDGLTGPAWANGHDDPGVDPQTNDPQRIWFRDIIKDEFCAISLVRDDLYIPEENKVIEGQLLISVSLDRNDSIEFISPAFLREAGQRMLTAADEIDQILAGGK